jgi:hypothetical protein
VAELKHIERIYESQNTLRASLDAMQIAIESDNAHALTWKDNNATPVYYTAAMQYSWDGSTITYIDNEFGAVTAHGGFYTDEYLRWLTDSDHRIKFATGHILGQLNSVDVFDASATTFKIPASLTINSAVVTATIAGGGGMGGPFTELLVTDAASSSYIGLSTGFASAGKYFFGLRSFVGTGGGTDYTIHATQESGVLTVLKMLDEFNFYKYDAGHYAGAKRYLQYGGVDIIAGSGAFSLAPSATNVSMLDVVAGSISKTTAGVSKQIIQSSGFEQQAWNSTLSVFTTQSALGVGTDINGAYYGKLIVGDFFIRSKKISDISNITTETTFGALALYENQTPIVDKYQPIFSGIVDKTKIVPTLAARKFKITCTSGAKTFCGGFPYYPVTFEMANAFANVTGSYFFYWNSSGVLTVTNTPWDILTTAQIAWCYHNATDNFQMLFDDRHPGGSTSMSEADHAQEHLRNGTWIKSGCVLTASAALPATGASMACAVSGGVLADEDLFTTITGLTSANNIPLWSRVGTEAQNRLIEEIVGPIGIKTSGASPNVKMVWNKNTAGTWSEEPANTANRWYCSFCVVVPRINPTDGSIYRQVCWIVPQQEHSSLVNAQNETSATLLLGGLVLQEAKFIGKKIFKYENNATTTPDVELVQVQIISENRVTVINNLSIMHSMTTLRDAIDSHPIGALTGAVDSHSAMWGGGVKQNRLTFIDSADTQCKASSGLWVDLSSGTVTGISTPAITPTNLTETRIPFKSADSLIDHESLRANAATGELYAPSIGIGPPYWTPRAGYLIDAQTSNGAAGALSLYGVRSPTTAPAGQAGFVAQNNASLSINIVAYSTGTTSTTLGQDRAGATTIYSSGGPLLFGTYSAHPVYIGTNNATNLTIASGGAITATSSFAAGGAISNSIAGASAITTTNSTDGIYTAIGNNTALGYVGTTTDHDLEIRRNGTAVATINSAGLCIGGNLGNHVFETISADGIVAIRNSTARGANNVCGGVLFSGRNASGTDYTPHCFIEAKFESSSSAQARLETRLANSAGSPNKAFTIYSNGSIEAVGGFGCNTKAAQAAYALPANATNDATSYALNNAIKAALIANGICS